MNDSWTIVAVVAGVPVLVALIASRLLKSDYVVFDYQRAVRYRDGRFVGLLGPGKHTFWSFGNTDDVRILDARTRTQTVAGQEVLSADGVGLKVSLIVEYRVVDARTAVESSESFEAALYAKAQEALRNAAASKPVDELLSARGELGARLTDDLKAAAASLGLEALSIAIKDFIFPGTLKEAFSQTARAKQAAAAALERARGEAAALRNLANAARLMESNPRLYQLRLLQAAAESGKIVVNVAAPESNVAERRGGSTAAPSDDGDAA